MAKFHAGFVKKKKTQSEEMGLQITSMADVFTILLVFLLKSYATGAVALSPSKGMILPKAHAGETQVEALKIEVSETAVAIEGKPVSELRQFQFQPKDIASNLSSPSLSAALEIERKRQLTIAKVNADVKVDAKVIIVADSRVPYETIKSVLASAALHGYTDFKLATLKPE
jgi:biopolymer transport protein ExbD